MKLAITIVLVAASVFAGMLYAISVEEKAQRQSDREWVEFSIAHHCKLTQPEKFWGVTSMWTCDGTDIVRKP